MDGVVVVVVFLLVAAGTPAKQFTMSENISANSNKECPLWHYYNSTSGSCECGNNLNGAVECHKSGGISVKACYCMTLDGTGETAVASCPYSCYYLRSKMNSISKDLEVNLTSQLDEATCAPYQRKGFLCGECRPNYGIPVYSYSFHCKNCSSYKRNWLKYVLVAYFPLTMFYFIIIVFQISANSGLMIGYVVISQMVATSNANALYMLTNPKKYKRIAEALVMVYSIWNLDFFRSYYPPFCLSPTWTALQLLSLDYIVAVYPIFLILLTYITVQLYSYNCPLVALLCKPVYVVLHYIRKEWSIGSSLMDGCLGYFIHSFLQQDTKCFTEYFNSKFFILHEWKPWFANSL